MSLRSNLVSYDNTSSIAHRFWPTYSKNKDLMAENALISIKNRFWYAESRITHTTTRDASLTTKKQREQADIDMKKNSALTNWLSPPILLTILIGLTISIAIFNVMRNQERHEAEVAFKHEMDKQSNALKRDIDIDIEVLLDLRAFYEASSHVSRAEFHIFTEQALIRHPGLQALEWIPLVTAAERTDYETLAQSDGFSDFYFTERTEQGDMVPTTERAEYFPVYYIEPYLGNELALGFDLTSSPTRLTTLTQSRETGEILGTARITLIQEQGEKFGFLVFAPIYNQDSTIAANHPNMLTGFVVGVYNIDNIVNATTSRTTSENTTIKLWINDISEPMAEQLLYENSPDSKIDARLEYQQTIAVAGRSWLINGQPTTEFIAAYYTKQPYFMLIAGLLFTGLLAAYLQQRISELGMSKGTTRAIVDSAIDGIISINAQGAIKSFNPAAERIFGYTTAEVMDKNVKLLMPDPYHNEHDGYLSNYIHTNHPKIIGSGREVVGQRKDGTTFPIDLAVSEARIGKQRLFIGITRDITQREKKKKELINAKEQAEEANKLKSNFLNVMSHELRTPLTVMLGNLPLLTDPDDLPEAEEIAEISQDIEESGKHLLVLINDLLDISKIEAGKMKLNLDMLTSVDVVNNAVSFIMPMAKQKGLTIETEMEDLVIQADAMRLKQILINLFSNAIKFTDHGGITVVVKAMNGYACFQIQDTGHGMAPKDLPRIFDKFQQADSSSTRSAQGTGLGLAITKKLVELHGGDIEVESQIGVGSLFTFTIPLAFTQGENDA